MKTGRDTNSRSRRPSHVRALLRKRFGLFPLLELRLKCALALPALRMRIIEELEVRSALRRLGGPIVADIVTVIPTYRRPELLRQAIQSAIRQRCEGHIVIVVDDGGGQIPSLDDLHDLPVVTIRLKRNTKVAGVVRNVGIGVSRSPIVAFLDDDNAWLPNHLELALDAHADGAEMTYSGLRRLRPDGSVVDTLSVPFDRRLMRERAFVDTSAIVVRRTRGCRFSRVPRGRATVPGEDWEFAYRNSRRLSTVHISETTVEYLIHSGSYFTEW